MRGPRPVRQWTPAQRRKRMEKLARRRESIAERRAEREEAFPFVGPMNRAQALAQFDADLPLYGAWLADPPDADVWHAVVARQMANRNLVFAYFAMSRRGEGLTECFGDVDFSESRFQRVVLERLLESGAPLAPADPDRVQRTIQAARARAEARSSLPAEWSEIGGIVAPLPEGQSPDFSLLHERSAEAEKQEESSPASGEAPDDGTATESS